LTHRWGPCTMSLLSTLAPTASCPCRLHIGCSWVTTGQAMVSHCLSPLSGSRGWLRRYAGLRRSHAVYPGLPPAHHRWGHHTRSSCPVHCRAAPPCQGPSLSTATVTTLHRHHGGAGPWSGRPSAGIQCGRGPLAGLAQCGTGSCGTTAAGHAALC
jgi:hypothetical protein